MKKWYITKMVFHILAGKGSQTQFDEQIRLVEAATAEDAFMQARTIGREEEHTFLNNKGEQVSWKFIDVAGVEMLNTFKHGAEIFSCISDQSEPEEYINFIQRKAQTLQLKHESFA